MSNANSDAGGIVLRDKLRQTTRLQSWDKLFVVDCGQVDDDDDDDDDDDEIKMMMNPIGAGTQKLRTP